MHFHVDMQNTAYRNQLQGHRALVAEQIMSESSMDWASTPPQHHAVDDRTTTSRKIREFFLAHTAYELIPESGKVIVLDADLTLKQAFHALYEQSISSAPLWDSIKRDIVGMMSPSDFIDLQRLLNTHGISRSDIDIERQTIRGLRSAAISNKFVRSLLSCAPSDTLAACVMILIEGQVSAIPVIHYDDATDKTVEKSVSEQMANHMSNHASESSKITTGLPVILHMATLSDVFGMLIRFFRTSMASLPILGHPIGTLNVGTWASIEAGAHGGIHTVGLDTPLSAALHLLTTVDVGALPVVDANGVVQEVYCKSDIMALALDSAYQTIDWDKTTISQALTHVYDAVARSNASGIRMGSLSRRCSLITKAEPLRGVIERLSISVRYYDFI